jgi:cytochrome b6-f complex iron-sulfur subunit
MKRADRETSVTPPKAESRKPKAGVSPQAASREPPAGLLARRSALGRLAAAVGLAGVGAQAAIVLRSVAPNVSYDPPTRVKIGRSESFADGLTFVPDRRVFVVRDGKTFRAVSAVCTHLGCTVRPEALEEPDPTDPQRRRLVQTYTFACPCHGSRYRADGVNVSGPAPRPLAVYRLALSPDDGQLVVDLGDEVARTSVLTLP